MKNIETENIFYYYLRREDPLDKTAIRGKSYGVVAIRMNEDGTVNRGISYCSQKDSFKKSVGRGIALSRLLKAEIECRNGENFSPYFGKCPGAPEDFGNKQQKNIYTTFTIKGYFHSEMTCFEYRMFHKPDFSASSK